MRHVSHCSFGLLIALVGAAFVATPASHARGAEGFTVFTQPGAPVDVFRDGRRQFLVGYRGWGPKWQPYLGFRDRVTATGATGRVTSTVSRIKDTTQAIETKVSRPTPTTIAMDIELTTDADADLLYIVASVEPSAAYNGGRAVFVQVDGTETEKPIPMGKGGVESCKELRLIDPSGDVTRITIEPALPIGLDNAARLMLAAERIEQGEPAKAKLTVHLPGPSTYYPAPSAVPEEPRMDDWFSFDAKCDMSKPSEFAMADWIEAPAGRHGRIRSVGDRLMYNGKPIKLWGLNLCYGGACPDKELADQRAAFYTRYGVNAVRLHKYADGPSGILSRDSFLEFVPEKLDLMDYQVAKFKEHGIYTKLSSTFHVKLGEKELARVPYAKELGRMSRGRLNTGTGSIYVGKELQDLQIEQMVRILEHRNPYTGLTYAADPCIAVVELFNEDSVLFGGTMKAMQRSPTIRDRMGRRFHAWLKAKYGTKAKLLEAWGEKAWASFEYEKLTGDDWEKGVVLPAGAHPWYLDPTQLDGSQAFRKRRLLDTAQFFYEVQNEFYARYVAAIRETGYDGAILASNWQAGRAYSHYLNLHSDARVGIIDRHNYFGGGRGRINNQSMLAVPGSGMLSAGMQQVHDRPFMLSEWIHVYPNEWGVEGPAIIGAYGMGLQGWDVSYIFQNRDRGEFKRELGAGGHDVWELMTPQCFGVFPAVSRQVLRGDVNEADVDALRYVHVPSLAEGEIGFVDEMTQQHDVKSFDSDKVTAETLAVARCAVAFTDEPRPTPAFSLDAYRRGGALRSATGQLAWHAGDSPASGYFRMDTKGTQAVVGFADGVRCELGAATIEPRCRYAAVYVTAADRGGSVADAKKLLIVAIARARNTGARIHADRLILDRGGPPILMEPVKATIRLDRPGTPTVRLLDHDGGRTDKTLSVRGGAIDIDTGRDQTCYYLVEY